MMWLRTYFVLVVLAGTSVLADDWPTHLHDNQRTGTSTESLSLPLQRSWTYRLPHAPRPAWPAPAKQDYWHRKTNLRPRIVYDRANSMVVAKHIVVLGSSSDDQVRALNADSGALLWSRFAEGPVRLAPTIWKDLVVFGADDGCVYGVELVSGKRRWKTRAPQIGLRRIPGNGRIISERPIRSGVLIDDSGTGYFVAGIFPKQGSFFFSLDVRDGRILDHARIEKSIQGYLERRDGRVFAPTGRDPNGVFLSGTAASRQTGEQQPLEQNTYSRISDASHVFLGRRNEVIATTRTGEEIWQAAVDGLVYALAIADGKLFVSTDKGILYAFCPASAEEITSPSVIVELPPPATSPDIQNDRDPRPGIALHIEPQVGELLEWMTRNSMQTVVAVSDEGHAEQLRSRLAAVGMCGRASVHVHESIDQLPYAGKVFNLIVGGTKDSVRHLLCPYGGVAHCEDGILEINDPVDLGSWTHSYGNVGNTASSSTRLGNHLQLQWFGGPGPRHMVDRHMRTMSPLVSRGRMYVPGLDRLITVDAFNGTVLWERELPESTRIGILKDCGWLAADEERVFVALKDHCQGFATVAGKPVSSGVFTVPFNNREWGYVARVRDFLIGSCTQPGAARRTVNRAAILEGAYTDNRPIVCSDGLFVFDVDSHDLLWKRSSGLILNPSISANQEQLFFVESDAALDLVEGGRVALNAFLASGARLIAVNLESGHEQWQVDVPSIDQVQNAFIVCNDERVILVNSRNQTTVHYDVRVFDAANGMQQWTATQDNRNRVGGDHGEQDKHPVLVENRLVVEPFAYDLETGHRLTEIDLRKRGYGCGTLSASADALFFRSGNPATYLFASNKFEQINTVSRPGCWINIIPASGLLLIPEGSSGCTCNFPIQTSMAFAPK